MSVAKPKTDAQWEAENDANTLINAEAIKLDRARLGKATIAAKRLATEKTKEAKAAAKVSRSSKTSTPKAGRKRR